MNYRPDIDGLRAIAVVSVLFYHAKLSFPGGYVGVDVFFVISGFLITSILAKNIRSGRFSYLDFWERRIRRLVPALALTTLVTALVSFWILLPEDLIDLGQAMVAQPLLSVNVHFWRAVQGGYFGDPPEIRPMLHTWSLGVEEQYYLLFPTLLLLVMKVRKIPTGLIVAVMALASLLLSGFMTPSKGVFAFFMLPTRAWEMLLGSLLVFLPRPKSLGLAGQILAATGLLMIAYSVTYFHDDLVFPGWVALIPTLATAALIYAGGEERPGLVQKFLGHPINLFFGKISYSLYLWHWPLMALAGYIGLLVTPEARWLSLGLSIVLGYASCRWVEAPFRDKVWLPSRRSIFAFFGVYAAGSIAMGLALVGALGFPQHWSPEAERFQAAKFQRSRAREVNPLQAGVQPQPLGASGAPVKFLLWGDSHAMNLAPALHRLAQRADQAGLQLTHSATAPLLQWSYAPEVKRRAKSPKFKQKWAELALKQVEQHRPSTVFLAGYWSEYLSPDFASQLQATLAALNQRGVRVVLVYDIPNQERDILRGLRLSTRWPQALPQPVSAEVHHGRNAALYQIFPNCTRPGQVETLDPSRVILEWPALHQQGQALYLDDDHLTDSGSLLLMPLFEPYFEQPQAVAH